MRAIGKIYNYYTHYIYPKVKRFRGSTFLKRNIAAMLELTLDRVEYTDSIWDEKWDNLIILDGCRHDIYEAVNGDTPKKNSIAGRTQEFIGRSFRNRDNSDIVYVSANPHISDKMLKDIIGSNDSFFATYETFNTDWDEEEGTVLPEPVVRDAINAAKMFPEKHRVVHFMQPHVPFIDSNISVKGFRPDLEIVENIWDRARKGELDQDRLRQAYIRNLEYVMPYVDRLSEELPGKTVITSDHGNFLGESGIYGHPFDSKAKAVREVPWEVRK